MSATALTPTTVVSPYGAGPGAGVAEAAADTGNGNSFVNDGRTLLVVRNSDAAEHAFTVRGKSFSVPAVLNSSATARSCTSLFCRKSMVAR